MSQALSPRRGELLYPALYPLPEQENGVALSKAERLAAEEFIIRQRVEDARRIADDIALAMHRIREEGLWLHARDHSGEPFPGFDAYLRHLADEIGLGRSTLYDYASMARVALVNDLATEETFSDCGGVYGTRNDVAELEIERTTGKILGLKNPKDGENPSPETLIEILRERREDLKGLVMPPRERRKLMMEAVSAAPLDFIWSIEPIVSGGVTLHCKMTEGTRLVFDGYTYEKEFPDAAREELERLTMSQYRRRE